MEGRHYRIGTISVSIHMQFAEVKRENNLTI